MDHCSGHFFNPINKGADYKPPKNRSHGSLVTTVSLAPSIMLSVHYLVNIDQVNEWFDLVEIRK